MPNLDALAVVQAAACLTHSHPRAPAIDVLDGALVRWAIPRLRWVYCRSSGGKWLRVRSSYARPSKWHHKLNDIRLNLARALLKGGDKSGARRELETLSKLGDKDARQSEVNDLLKSL